MRLLGSSDVDDASADADDRLTVQSEEQVIMY